MNRVNNSLKRKHNYPIPAARSDEKTNKTNGLFRSASIGFGVSLSVAAVIILVFTAAATGSNDPEKYSSAIAIASLFISAFVGGFVTKRLYKSSPALCGLLCGCMLTVVSLVISLIIASAVKTEADYSVTASVLLRVATIPVSMLGAAVKLNLRQNKHKRHRIR